jgi:hypothetical protein
MLAFKGEKRILILSVVVAALILLYVLGVVFSPANRRRREMETPLFQILNKEMIAHIAVTSGQETLELRKAGDDWTVRISGVYFPASGTRVNAFLDHIISLKRSKRVSDDPETWEDFEVTETLGRRLILAGAEDKTLVNLFIGKPGVGGEGTYVRQEGSEEVIEADKSFSYYMNLEPRFWSHLKLFPENLDFRDIVRLNLKRRDGFAAGAESFVYALVRDENQDWIVEGRPDLALSNERIDRLSGALADFEGTEFLVGIPREEAGFDSPSAEISFTTADEREFRLLVGSARPDTEQYYVCLDGQTYCYLAASWRLENILKSLSELKSGETGG